MIDLKIMTILHDLGFIYFPLCPWRMCLKRGSVCVSKPNQVVEENEGSFSFAGFFSSRIPFRLKMAPRYLLFSSSVSPLQLSGGDQYFAALPLLAEIPPQAEFS